MGSVTPRMSSEEEQTEEMFTEQFRLDKQTGRYYVSALNEGQMWDINLTSVYRGIFYLFIFDNRPESDYFLENGSLNKIVYTNAVAYNNTPIILNSTLEADEINYFINLSYKATVTKLYYLLVYLAQGTTPDTFILKSNAKIQAYFIPFIDGFPIEVILGNLGLGAIVIYRKTRRKKVQKN